MDLFGVLVFLGLVIVTVIWKIRDLQKKNQTTILAEDARTSVKKTLKPGSPLPWPPQVAPLETFTWKDESPSRLRPFKSIYHITMALQSTAPEDLIVLDSNYKDRIVHRRSLIQAHPEIVMGAVSPSFQRSELDPQGADPRAKAVVEELYTYLMDTYLCTRYPTVFTKQKADGGQFMLHNHVTNTTFPCTPPLDPLDAFRILGETVEDDFMLLLEENTSSATPENGDQPVNSAPYPETSHRLFAFLCCFPAGFDPASKLGLRLREIHKPVPSYDKIGPSMERFFSRTVVGRNAKRLNWSVQTHTGLFTPGSNHIYEGQEVNADEDVDISQARLRVECQTVSRLPKTDAILFSFKTYLFPVQDIKSEGQGPALADAIEGLQQGNAPGMWVYKGAVRWGKSVCEYLRS